MKTGFDRNAKLQTYRRIVVVLWALTIFAFELLGRNLWRAPAFEPRTGFLPSAASARAFVAGLCIAVVTLLVLPLVFAMRRTDVRPRLRKQFGRLAFFLPRRQDELRWFGAVCITAGICEEVLYRGFLIPYLSVWPHRFGPETALAIGAVLFGLGHTYQGVTGIVTTGIVGLVLGATFLLSGNLAVPIALHVAIDLRAWFLLRWVAQRE